VPVKILSCIKSEGINSKVKKSRFDIAKVPENHGQFQKSVSVRDKKCVDPFGGANGD
jgi:hypothetical protein